MFKKAVKSQAKLRMAITGPSGSGKTYTALTVATSMADRVALIDTERGSASKYADIFSGFDVQELTEYNPRNYIEAIRAACASGYDVLVIDSLSHAWSGQGGVLELVDRAAKRSQSQNSFAAWRDVTPLHNQLVDTILGSPIHIIATMRSKTEYVLERDERGRTTPRKVGLAPVQRDGMEYEFDVVAEMDMDNNMIISKSRIVALTGGVVNRPDGQFGELLKAWLSDGALAPIQTTERATRGRHDRSIEETLSDEGTNGLPHTLGELKQLVVVEKKWIKGGEVHWRTMIDLLKQQGIITDEDDYPTMYLAIEEHYGKKKLKTASGE